MWLVGVVTLLLVSCGLCVRLAWRPSQGSAEIWDIPGTTRTYTTIVGTLAGFSVTSSVFIANLTVARQSANFEGIMALFLIAFLVFVSSAIQFGTTPNLPQGSDQLYRTVQGYSYILANTSFYLGLCLSWLGLPLLLDAIELDYLADRFIWLVLFAILGGAMRISSSGLNIFAAVDLRLGLSLPFICFFAAALYHLAGQELLDELLPEAHDQALFGVLAFAVAALGFSLQSTMVGALRQASSVAGSLEGGRLAVIVYSAAIFTIVSLLWLSVLNTL